MMGDGEAEANVEHDSDVEALGRSRCREVRDVAGELRVVVGRSGLHSRASVRDYGTLRVTTRNASHRQRIGTVDGRRCRMLAIRPYRFPGIAPIISL
jgi:hypothetical protein